VRSVSDIIEARMRAIGHALPDAAGRRVERIDRSASIQTSASRSRASELFPSSRSSEWQRALQLDGELAEEFDLAVRLTHSDAKIRELIARQDLELAEARAAMLLYEERIEDPRAAGARAQRDAEAARGAGGATAGSAAERRRCRCR
jgi:hypothetical protein